MNLAEKSLGLDIGELKVRSTGSKPNNGKDNVVEIPSELIEQHKDPIHLMYIMYVNKMAVLTYIDRTIRYQSLA